MRSICTLSFLWCLYPAALASAQSQDEAEVRALMKGWAFNLRPIEQYQVYSVTENQASVPTTGLSNVIARSLESIDREDQNATIWFHRRTQSDQGVADQYGGSVIADGKMDRCLVEGAWVDLESFRGRSAAGDIVPRDVRQAGVLWTNENSWKSTNDPMKSICQMGDVAAISDYAVSDGRARFKLTLNGRGAQRFELSFTFDLANQLPIDVSLASSDEKGGMYAPFQRESIRWRQIGSFWVPAAVTREDRRVDIVGKGKYEEYMHFRETSYRYITLNGRGDGIEAGEDIRDEASIWKLLESAERDTEFLPAADK